MRWCPQPTFEPSDWSMKLLSNWSISWQTLPVGHSVQQLRLLLIPYRIVLYYKNLRVNITYKYTTVHQRSLPQTYWGCSTINSPTECFSAINSPTEGCSTINSHTEGFSAINSPTEGCSTINSPTEGFSAINSPTEGCSTVHALTQDSLKIARHRII